MSNGMLLTFVLRVLVMRDLLLLKKMTPLTSLCGLKQFKCDPDE